MIPLMMVGQEVQFSKDIFVKAGLPYQVIDARNKDYFSNDNDAIIAVKTDGSRVFIQKIDTKTQKEVSRKEYSDFPKDFKLQEVEKYGKRLFYFYSSYDKKEKNESVFVREVNMENATFEKPIFLFKTSGAVTQNIVDYEVQGMFESGIVKLFEFRSSFDNSKMLIRYRLKPTEKRDKNNYDVLGFFVFDTKQMSKLSGDEIKMPYTEAEMDNIEYAVGSNGDAYMLAYLRDSKKYEWLYKAVNDKDFLVSSVKISNTKSFQALKILEDVNGNFSCSGYFINGYYFSFNPNPGARSTFVLDVDGYSNFVLSPDGDLLSENLFEFSDELVGQNRKKSFPNSDEIVISNAKSIKGLKLREIKELEDETTIVVGEQYWVEQKYNYTTDKTERIYHYEDVVMTKFNKAGEILWMKKLPKLQTGKTGKGGMGIKYFETEGQHYVLFLDNVKNMNLEWYMSPAKHEDGKGGFLTAYKIDDKTSEVSKISILDVRDIDGMNVYQFKTSRLLLANENELFLEVYIKGKKDSMIKIKLD